MTNCCYVDLYQVWSREEETPEQLVRRPWLSLSYVDGLETHLWSLAAAATRTFFKVQKIEFERCRYGNTTVRSPDIFYLRLKLFFNYPAIDTSPVETVCRCSYIVCLYRMSETSSASVASNSVPPPTNMAFVSHSGNWEGEYYCICYGQFLTN